MPGKYDFPGIKKVGTAALETVLAGTGWGASMLASPFRPLFKYVIGYAIEWAANKGLVIINLGFIYVGGELDQSRFDKAMDEALERVKVAGLAEKQKEQIDNEVREAFRKFAHLNSKPTQP